MTTRGIGVIGGPGAGKTAWLSALLEWVGGRGKRYLHYDGMSSNAQALRQLQLPLTRQQYPQRTPIESGLGLDVPLRTSGDHIPEVRFSLHVSDYAGEELNKKIFQERTWGDTWQNRSEQAALLIFVRIPHNEGKNSKESGDFVPLPRLQLQEPPDEDSPEAWGERVYRGQSRPPAPGVSSAVQVPTVLSLIEVLQALRHQRGLEGGERPEPASLRIGVVISAWDAMPQDWKDAGPTHYMQQELALLDDFLWSNFQAEDVRCFGLSSTGGDLNDPEYKIKYKKNPCGYVQWTDAFGRQQVVKDIAAPLYWALFGDRGLPDGSP